MKYAKGQQNGKRGLPEWIAAIALLTVLMGCEVGKDDFRGAMTGESVTFNPSVATVISSVSRGIPVTETDQTALQSMGVYACYTQAASFDEVSSVPNYMDNQLVTRTFSEGVPNEWSYSPGKYWPAPGNKLTFLAYAPHNSQCSGLSLSQEAGSAYPKMSFSVDADIKAQADLLIAKPAIDCDVVRGTTVTLEMKHALTLISFSAAVQNAAISGQVRVTKITVSGVLSSGKTSMNTPVVWTEQGNPATYQLSVEEGTLTGDALTTTLLPLNTPGSLLLLMPQLFNDETATITVEYSGAGGTETVHKESFFIIYTGEVWRPGQSINYQIRLDAERVELVASLIPWGNLKEFNGGDSSLGLLPWE